MDKPGKIIFTYLLFATGFASCSKTDKSETPALTQATVLLTHTLPSLLHESSGLCYTNSTLWTFGDSGNPNAIYKIDTATGAVLQTVVIQNFPNEDWEDITADDDYIYIGDFGNNNGNREDLKVLRIRKSDLSNTFAEISIHADAIHFSYSDQTDFTVNSHNNFNCEALVSIEDHLYIFSKDEGDFKTRCYKIPKNPGSYSVMPISSFNVDGEITSAAYNPATNELALGGYESQKIHPFIWFFKEYPDNHFFEGDKIKVVLSDTNTPWQTEGIDYISSNRMFLSCESTPDIPASLFTVSLTLDY